MKNSFQTVFIFGLLITFLFALSGCDNHFFKESQKPVTENFRTSSVSQSIGNLREAGLLDSILKNNQSARFTSGSDTNIYGEIDIDQEKLNLFIYNTDAVLEEIAQSENGDVQLQLIELMFTGGTVGEIATVMAAISEDMANEYLTAIESSLSGLLDNPDPVARSAYSTGSISDIRLGFYNSNQTRTAYAPNLEWTTVGWYAGFCAATVAGVYASDSAFLWIKIPGIVAATAGAASMVVQLIQWRDCKDLVNFITGITKKDASVIKSAFAGGHGANILTIAGLTAGTAVSLAFSPVGRVAISTFKDIWNGIVDKITAATGINLTINGITFKRIP